MVVRDAALSTAKFAAWFCLVLLGSAWLVAEVMIGLLLELRQTKAQLTPR
mgnify:CR=1 FL=1